MKSMSVKSALLVKTNKIHELQTHFSLFCVVSQGPRLKDLSKTLPKLPVVSDGPPVILRGPLRHVSIS